MSVAGEVMDQLERAGITRTLSEVESAVADAALTLAGEDDLSTANVADLIEHCWYRIYTYSTRVFDLLEVDEDETGLVDRLDGEPLTPALTNGALK